MQRVEWSHTASRSLVASITLIIGITTNFTNSAGRAKSRSSRARSEDRMRRARSGGPSRCSRTKAPRTSSSSYSTTWALHRSAASAAWSKRRTSTVSQTAASATTTSTRRRSALRLAHRSWQAATHTRSASAPVKNRSHTITTNLDLSGNEEGVIVAVGGMTGGFTMFIKQGKLYYDYNYLDGVHYTLESPRLSKGKTKLEFRFMRTGQFAGTGELYVNGKKVDEADMHMSTYSLAETFDVGRDTGTQVSKLYKGPYPLQGELDRVVILMTD